MIRLGPITIAWTQEVDVLHNVVKAAWPVHQEIWAFGENYVWPNELAHLPVLDFELSNALSYAPIEDAPTNAD